MAKETIELFISITTKDNGSYSCPVDSVEIDNINLGVYTKQGGLNFEYNDIKSLRIGIHHDNDYLELASKEPFMVGEPIIEMVNEKVLKKKGE